MSSKKIQVAVCMGSDSDWPVMCAATQVLSELGISNKPFVLSAHRMPLEMTAFAQSAREARYPKEVAHASLLSNLFSDLERRCIIDLLLIRNE